jgi:signal transduction histidine kinase
VTEREQVLAGGGEMGALMRSIDWSLTPLGPVEGWPGSLRTVVSVVLSSEHAMFVWWGPELVQFYNDAYRPILGSTKHPRAMGQRGREGWQEIWPIIEPMIEKVLAGGATNIKAGLLLLERHGFAEECYFDYAYSPIRDETSAVAGVFVACSEVSASVIGERRLRALGQLGAVTLDARTPDLACQAAANVLGEIGGDLPFALVYLLDEAGVEARLAAAVGLEASHPAAPPVIAVGQQVETWPLGAALTREIEVETAALPFAASLPGGPWPEAPRRAVVLPLERSAEERPHGFLVAGVSPRLLLDEAYRGFLKLVSGHLASALQNARAYEEEKRRGEALAELDRAKTAFFSNVSHEFRTPITLMLGPVEDGLADADQPLSPGQRERQERVLRNGQRLLKLVNTLLEFSRLEAGRAEASFQPTDLAALTAGLVSAFDSTVARAALRLEVDCAPLPEPIWVDRDMWEKVVLNLVSNAFKFTFTGTISVRLAWKSASVELSVADTGTGIPAEEIPYLFERFHQVRGSPGRSFEGSGIGLALVRELVKLHGGSVQVESALGQGSTFTVSVPTGQAHLPPAQVDAPRPRASTSTGAALFLQEASGWLDGAEGASTSPLLEAQPTGGHILLADDSADMRGYVKSLLEGRYTVEAVADGNAAVEATRARVPDLVLSDVMMPGMDGFGLVQALKASERTARVPIILLSARAGEEATVEGLRSGADDYLVKPFGARELLARVEGCLRLARERTEREREAVERADFERQLIGIVSHDLRNPLAAILLSTQSLSRRQGLDEKSLKSLQRIQSSAERGSRLVGDLLDFTQARLGGGIPVVLAPCDLHAVVRQVVEDLSMTSGGREVRAALSGDGEGTWDAERLAQVVQNIVGNALKYSPPSSTVDVRSEGDTRGVTVSVHNTGEPIAEEALGRIFQPLQRATSQMENASRSVGLGLFIVKHLVEAHGGRLSVTSTPEAGTTFTFWVPKQAGGDV